MTDNQTTAGIHPSFQIQRFSGKEKRILDKLSKEWYLTSSGSKISLALSSYEYFLVKPIPIFTEMFNLEREIICVFSDYEHFEPRTLSAFSQAQESIHDLRTEKVCRILISNDPKVEEKIDSLLKTDPEQPIIIPFTYDELLAPYDAFFFRNRFRKHFYSRDLFDFLSPLKSDLYFFGRSHLVHELVNRHKDGEHTGLFGLRKSGKTSIIYAVERTLSVSGDNYISIDCESPSIHKLRWNELLEKIITLYHKSISSKIKINTKDRYQEKFAADSFEEDILKIYNSKMKCRTLFIFDEIERVSPITASSDHWRNGDDFIYFWQTLRGFYQRNPSVFTYMLVGTNPSCVEEACFAGHENPIFASIPCQYVPNFNIEQVREMARKLGRYMGLKFDEIIYSKLTEDFGGHPFLIRQACSVIHNECKGDRPATVDKALYEKIKKNFIENSVHYLDMVMQVLRDFYPDEYEMLKYLSQGDTDTFNEFAKDNVNFTKHLIGYGLIQKSNNGYAFNIEIVKEYLGVHHKYERINLTDEEKLEEISRRRNAIEKLLRKIIKNVLKIKYGENNALKKVLGILQENRREKLISNDLGTILSADSSPLFFLDLVNLIKSEWDGFQHIFDMEKNKATLILEEINRIGRPDAHAKNIANNDFDQVRLYFITLEKIAEEWS
jgi:hypothetical protein